MTTTSAPSEVEAVPVDVISGLPVNDPRQLIGRLRGQPPLRPFVGETIEALSDLSTSLLRADGFRANPATTALAFWLRRSRLESLRQIWEERGRQRSDEIAVPRGTVFHLPPTNVDTLFVYTWALSALLGNKNVVRISPNALEATSGLVDILRDVLQRHEVVGSRTSFLSYGHDAAVTEALSLADLRVVWGGDASVHAIRRVPQAPHGADLAFPDRFSIAALSTRALSGLDDDGWMSLARGLYVDSYWFDQMGCSSPRLIAMVGDERHFAEARDRLIAELRSRISTEGYEAPLGAVMNKLTVASALAADGAATRVDWHDPDVTVVDQSRTAPIARNAPGAGFFTIRSLRQLDELAPLLTRKDQTLSTFGFTRETVVDFVAQANGRGIDRVVPIGQALQFDHVWDGVDLMTAFSRLVAIRG